MHYKNILDIRTIEELLDQDACIQYIAAIKDRHNYGLNAIPGYHQCFKCGGRINGCDKYISYKELDIIQDRTTQK